MKSLKATTKKTSLNPKLGQETLEDLMKFINDLKLMDVVKISLLGKSKEADYMVIASGSSVRLVVSSAEKVVQYLKENHKIFSRTEGLSGGDWVLIDAGDIIIHLFRPEVRDYYQLEKMWQDPQVPQ